MPSQLIINADDFGAAAAVNAAVLKAHREGVLTSASLMVTGSAASEAASIARDQPGLAVGLHIALSRAQSALPREIIPDLVDNDSRFSSGAAHAALRYYFSRRARKQIRLEVEAQFAAFAETGLPLSHVDGHQHLHAHPAVLPAVLELALEYEASGIRIPRDPLLANVAVDRSRIGAKLFVAVGHAYLARVCRRVLHKSPLARCDASIGSLMSGNMSDAYVMKILDRVKCPSVEIFFHPAQEDAQPDPWGPNPGDLRAVLSPDLRRFIHDRGFELTNYPRLRAAGLEAAHERP